MAVLSIGEIFGACYIGSLITAMRHPCARLVVRCFHGNPFLFLTSYAGRTCLLAIKKQARLHPTFRITGYSSDFELKLLLALLRRYSPPALYLKDNTPMMQGSSWQGHYTLSTPVVSGVLRAVLRSKRPVRLLFTGWCALLH